MLMLPAVIVALLFSLIVGPLTVSQRFQTRGKLLGHRVQHKLSVLRTLLGIQDFPTAFETTTLPAFPIETGTVHCVETTSLQVQSQDYVVIIIPEVTPTEYNDQRPTAPARVFLVVSQHQGPFHWRDLLNYRVFETITVLIVSLSLPLVATPFIAGFFSSSESLNQTKPPSDQTPKPLPPKYLTPPTTIQTSNRTSHAPLEPIFSLAPSEVTSFWLASEAKRQEQPSPRPLHLLYLPSFETESQKKLSPLSSPADSGYGTTLPDATSNASPLDSDASTTITPEHLDNPLPTSDAKLTPASDRPFCVRSLPQPSSCLARLPGSDKTTRGENVNTVGFDTELEDDDDGSTTVTNSIANLTHLTPPPAPVPAQDLAARLESVTTSVIQEVEPLPEGPLVAHIVLDDPTAKPPHDEPTTDKPSNCDSSTDLGTDDGGFVVEQVSVEIFPPGEPCLDQVDAIPNSSCTHDRVATGSDLDVLEEETAVEGDLPPEADLGGVEPWVPNGEIPTIVISPPSEVDPEDFAPQLDSEGEPEESEWDSDCELEYAGDYPDESVVEASPACPLSPVRDDPCRSPITTSGLLWSDDECEEPGPGPLPFQTEVQDPPASEEVSGTVADDCENPNAAVEEPVIEMAPELEPVEEQQPALEAPLEAPAQEVVDSVSIISAPSLSTSTDPLPPFCAHEPPPTHIQASVNSEDRGEGSSRSGRSSAPRRLQYFHCCNLYKSDGRPESWENWEMEKVCIPHKSNLRESQFVRPTDKDGENPTTRIAIDNFDATWFRKANGVPSYKYLAEALEPFTTKSSRCWSGRTIHGIEYAHVGYATVDFDSLDEAIRAFKELQGRRLRGHTWHWRLEFVDPEDETHGGRKAIRTELVPESLKRTLVAQLEASTSRHRPIHSDNIGAENIAATKPSTRVRPQLSIPRKSLLAGAMATVVQDRRSGGQPAKSSTSPPPRRPYRS